MDEKTIDSIFSGSLKSLPPVSSKIVRIFTSSTFTDTTMERNTLMAQCYPKLKDYCREKHGLEFQVVDMRWGVRDEATDDHMTTEVEAMPVAVEYSRLIRSAGIVDENDADVAGKTPSAF